MSILLRLFGVYFLISFVSAELLVTYPRPESTTDTRNKDLIEILQVALEKTVPEYGSYKLSPYSKVAEESRAIELLRTNDGLSVIWNATSKEKENKLRPIRIPLRKGILGYRIALINRSDQSLIDEVDTLKELRKLDFGQGIGWGDVKLYESNNIKVQVAPYESLFKMLDAGRFQLFPRGISEAYKEFDERINSKPNISVEENLLIVYPWPYYFFVNKTNDELATRLEAGLRMMLADGSFDEIFIHYNQKSMQRGNLQNRRIIRLNNPDLPTQTPLSDASLWFNPLESTE